MELQNTYSMNRTKLYFKGFTIIESIVGLILILIVTGLFYFFVERISLNSRRTSQLLSEYAFDKMSEVTNEEHDFRDLETTIGNIKIKKSCKPYDLNSKVLLIEYKSFDESGTVIKARCELILAD